MSGKMSQCSHLLTEKVTTVWIFLDKKTLYSKLSTNGKLLHSIPRNIAFAYFYTILINNRNHEPANSKETFQSFNKKERWHSYFKFIFQVYHIYINFYDMKCVDIFKASMRKFKSHWKSPCPAARDTNSNSSFLCFTLSKCFSNKKFYDLCK